MLESREDMECLITLDHLTYQNSPVTFHQEKINGREIHVLSKSAADEILNTTKSCPCCRKNVHEYFPAKETARQVSAYLNGLFLANPDIIQQKIFLEKQIDPEYVDKHLNSLIESARLENFDTDARKAFGDIIARYAYVMDVNVDDVVANLITDFRAGRHDTLNKIHQEFINQIKLHYLVKNNHPTPYTAVSLSAATNDLAHTNLFAQMDRHKTFISAYNKAVSTLTRGIDIVRALNDEYGTLISQPCRRGSTQEKIDRDLISIQEQSHAVGRDKPNPPRTPINLIPNPTAQHNEARDRASYRTLRDMGQNARLMIHSPAHAAPRPQVRQQRRRPLRDGRPPAPYTTVPYQRIY